MLEALFSFEVRGVQWSNFRARGAFSAHRDPWCILMRKKTIVLGALFSFEVRGSPWSNFGVRGAFSAHCAIFVRK